MGRGRIRHIGRQPVATPDLSGTYHEPHLPRPTLGLSAVDGVAIALVAVEHPGRPTSLAWAMDQDALMFTHIAPEIAPEAAFMELVGSSGLHVGM